MDLQYRSFDSDLEVRSSGDGRTVHGIAVPWEAPQYINESLTEQFARGAFDHQVNAAHRVRYAKEHVTLGGILVGTVRSMRNDAAGQYVEMRVSKTPAGDETLELVKDGALPHLSIGFRARRDRRVPGTGVIERTVADLFEVASTMQGAYGDLAPAMGVRSLQGGGEETRSAYCDQCTHCTTPAGLVEVRSILAGLPALQ